ncbi:MAG: single-stranded DNA-binding protein [Selenomonadaceae bacterium]|nr:single-stranded DNA-binding protein [Selenomonadaceae bacterium]
MNKVFVSGNLTRDPEVRYTQNGKAMVRMGIAVSRRVSKNSDNSQPNADFFNLTAWDKTAEFCGNYLKKGSRVLVEGRLQTYSYEGKDGSKRSGVDILVENIEFGSNKNASDDNSTGTSSYNKNNSHNDLMDEFSGSDIQGDEIPF